jgi:hypothetical protein
METGRSLLFSQEPVTGPYPGPVNIYKYLIIIKVKLIFHKDKEKIIKGTCGNTSVK